MRRALFAVLFLAIAVEAGRSCAGRLGAQRKDALVVYAAPGGDEVMLFAPPRDKEAMPTSQALVNASGGRLDHSKMYLDGPMAVFEFAFEKRGVAMAGAVFGADQSQTIRLNLTESKR
jgi:hypothetical protein